MEVRDTKCHVSVSCRDEREKNSFVEHMAMLASGKQSKLTGASPLKEIPSNSPDNSSDTLDVFDGKDISSVFYRRSNHLYGSSHSKAAEMNPNTRRKPLTNSFTKTQGPSHRTESSRFSTFITRDRVKDGQDDWMLRTI